MTRIVPAALPDGLRSVVVRDASGKLTIYVSPDLRGRARRAAARHAVRSSRQAGVRGALPGTAAVRSARSAPGRVARTVSAQPAAWAAGAAAVGSGAAAIAAGIGAVAVLTAGTPATRPLAGSSGQVPGATASPAPVTPSPSASASPTPSGSPVIIGPGGTQLPAVLAGQPGSSVVPVPILLSPPAAPAPAPTVTVTATPPPPAPAPAPSPAPTPSPTQSPPSSCLSLLVISLCL